MSELTIVPVIPEDHYRFIAPILNAASYSVFTEERLHHFDTRFIEGDIFEQYVGLVVDTVVGYCNLFQSNTATRPQMAIQVVTDETARRNGYGTQLYQHILQRAETLGAESLTAKCLEARPDALRFGEKHGFNIQHHAYESTLDVTTFDVKPYQSIVAEVEASGIRFSSLAAEGNNEENLFKLFVLDKRLVEDEPTFDGLYRRDYETWKARVAGADWFYPTGQLLAIDGEDFIGLGAVGFEPDGQAFNAFTGVLPDYRGRKIAQALKVKGIQFLQVVGTQSIMTDNDSRNAPMLAINEKFGYERLPGEYQLLKHLKEA